MLNLPVILAVLGFALAPKAEAAGSARNGSIASSEGYGPTGTKHQVLTCHFDRLHHYGSMQQCIVSPKCCIHAWLHSVMPVSLSHGQLDLVLQGIDANRKRAILAKVKAQAGKQ